MLSAVSMAFFQSPGDHDGEDLDTIPRPPPQASACYIPADTFLSIGYYFKLRFETGDKTQRHGEDQRHGWNDPAEKINEFIRSHHRIITGKPTNHRGKHHRRGNTVGNRLQRQRIAFLK